MIPHHADPPTLQDAPYVITGKSTVRTDSFLIEGSIPKVLWTPDHEFAQEVADRGIPVVLTNTAVETWPARDWTPDDVVDRLERSGITLKGTYRHSKPTFGPYWDPNRPLAKVKSVQRSNAHELVDMRPKELLQIMKDRKKGTHVYYSGNINNIGLLAADLMPWRFLELDPDSPQQNMNFWLGGKGTIADTHYDAYENFNVQIYGRKRWIIFPPDAPLYPFPFMHPSHAQSQVVIDEPDLEAFPQLKQAKGLEVIMNPGDVLYLPPLWYHHVEALDDSISVNCWSYSNQSDFMKEAVDKARPVQLAQSHKWNRHQAQFATKLFVVQLVDSLKGKDTATKFVRDLLSARYANLFKTKQVPSANTTSNFCDATAFSEKQQRDVQKDLADSVVSLTAIFRRFPANTRDLWLGNYVEYLAFHATQNASAVGAYLEKCFGSDFRDDD
eukprot:TRINITY_DN8011_c0_g1_i1.p1 TRINITY_DN8011_c0_g1~~TRINITY_DN8011_c0_g1_i1.p1  ORF type:complete len:442 (+),score=113.57 TRINITY_DN8011_c0_g1_i1:191-1516(+)